VTGGAVQSLGVLVSTEVLSPKEDTVLGPNYPPNGGFRLPRTTIDERGDSGGPSGNETPVPTVTNHLSRSTSGALVVP